MLQTPGSRLFLNRRRRGTLTELRYAQTLPGNEWKIRPRRNCRCRRRATLSRCRNSRKHEQIAVVLRKQSWGSSGRAGETRNDGDGRV